MTVKKMKDLQRGDVCFYDDNEQKFSPLQWGFTLFIVLKTPTVRDDVIEMNTLDIVIDEMIVGHLRNGTLVDTVDLGDYLPDQEVNVIHTLNSDVMDMWETSNKFIPHKKD